MSVFSKCSWYNCKADNNVQSSRSAIRVLGVEGTMYERMLNKQVMPAIEEMTSYCGECGEYFILLNEWMTDVFGTEQQVFFS